MAGAEPELDCRVREDDSEVCTGPGVCLGCIWESNSLPSQPQAKESMIFDTNNMFNHFIDPVQLV